MDTKECRSSLGVRSPPRLADLVIFRNPFRTCQRCSVLTAEHEVVFLPRLPSREPFGGLAGVMGAERLDRLGGQLQNAPTLAGLDVTLDPHRAVDGDHADLEVDLVPGDGPLYRFKTRRTVSNLRIHEISYAAR